MTLWYASGLRFSCSRCGACCKDRGEATVVVLCEGEPGRIAGFLGMPVQEFMKRSTRVVDGWLCLSNRGDTCALQAPDGRCSVHRARPLQCATWPFWPENLDRSRWDSEVLRKCPGAGHGRLHTAEQIELIAHRSRYARWISAK